VAAGRGGGGGVGAVPRHAARRVPGGGRAANDVRQPGKAVQADPIKPTLKAPGIKLLKLKYDTPLSNFALKFSMRRYNLVFIYLNLEEGAGRTHAPRKRWLTPLLVTAGLVQTVEPTNIVRQVIGCLVTQETRVEKALDDADVASNICQTLADVILLYVSGHLRDISGVLHQRRRVAGRGLPSPLGWRIPFPGVYRTRPNPPEFGPRPNPSESGNAIQASHPLSPPPLCLLHSVPVYHCVR